MKRQRQHLGIRRNLRLALRVLGRQLFPERLYGELPPELLRQEASQYAGTTVWKNDGLRLWAHPAAPEVAILGVVRSKMSPVWDGSAFQPRLMQPLYVSYDHRVIDGALATRFNVYLAQLLADMRRALI